MYIRCRLTAILSACSETKSSLVHLSSSEPLPRSPAQLMPSISADENVSPARKSALGWRRCEAFFFWVVYGSGTDGQSDGSQRKVRGQLKTKETCQTYFNFIVLTYKINKWLHVLRVFFKSSVFYSQKAAQQHERSEQMGRSQLNTTFKGLEKLTDFCRNNQKKMCDMMKCFCCRRTF